jgi:peptide/nickel transport system substrate-binding protein
MKKRLLLIILVLISVFLVSCQTGYNNNPGQADSGLNSQTSESELLDILDKGPVEGGNLNIYSSIPETLNPLTVKSVDAKSFLSFIYEGLTALDKDQSPLPVLSDSWTVSNDGMVWNFHIREGVFWHDGKVLTADDVQYTVDYIINNKDSSAYSNLLANVATYAAVDQNNFRIVLKKPNSFTAETMTFPILPRHRDAELKNANSVNTYIPIGTGPFAFASRQEGKQILLKKYGGWWSGRHTDNDNSPAMYIGEITVKLFDESTPSLDAFQDGEIDLSIVDSISTGNYQGRTDLTVKKYPSRNFEFISFNTTKDIFTDVHARNAVEAAINRDAVIKDVYKGDAEKSTIPILGDSWILGDIEADSYKEKPATILAEGGWKQSNKGFYKRIKGRTRYLNPEIIVNSSNKQRVSACKRIAEQLNSVGIKATVVELEWDELISRVNSGKFDMACLAAGF